MDHSVKSGTVGGTLLTIIISITAGDIIKTVILAFVGAVVSYAVARLLKWIFQN